MTGLLREMDHRSGKQLLLPALLIVTAVLITYVPAFRAGFVFDDHVVIAPYPLLQGPFWKLWWNGTMSDYWPLTWSSFWLEWRLWGENAAGYHTVNILGHATVALLLWRVLAALKIPGAWLAGLLFAVHPVAVESVAWITERKNILSAIFFLASLLAWLSATDSNRWRRSALALFLFLLALLAKVSVAMLPLVMLGIIYHRNKRISLHDIAATAPFFALSLVLGLINIWYQKQNAMSGWAPVRNIGERLATMGWAFASYVESAFAPFRLAFVYPDWPVSPSSPLFYLPLALVTAVFALLWLLRRSYSWCAPLLLALGYQLLMLLPVLGFLDMAYFMVGPVSNHLQYLALMGPAALAATAIVRLPCSPSLVTASILVLALGGVSLLRAGDFKSDHTLWTSAVEDAPRSVYARNQLSILLIDAGRTKEGLIHLDAAARHSRLPAEQHRFRSQWFLYAGRTEEAVSEARAALASGNSPELKADAAFVLAHAGVTDEAIALYRSFITGSMNYTSHIYTLAALLSRSGRLSEAADVLRDYCTKTPGNPRMEAAFGLTLVKLGLTEEARTRAAVMLNVQTTAPEVNHQIDEWRALAVRTPASPDKY